MKKYFLFFLLCFLFQASAGSYSKSDIEFIVKSNDSISYILSVEARELQIAEHSRNLLEELSFFYNDLEAAGAKGQQLKFLNRRKAGLLKIQGWAKTENPNSKLEEQLLLLSNSKSEIFKEKTEEQSVALIIHLFARNKAIVFKEATPDIAYLAGRAAFHSSLLGNEYLRRFLDLSDLKDKRRASAKEMLELIDAIRQ